jgi:hypothetical protein
MRTTTAICDRCGNTITDLGSIVEVTALGELRHRIDRLDLCHGCGELLLDWMRERKRALALESRVSN